MDLKNKTKEDLLKTLRDTRKSLYDFRLGISGSKVKNVKEGRNLKRDVARILTKING